MIYVDSPSEVKFTSDCKLHESSLLVTTDPSQASNTDKKVSNPDPHKLTVISSPVAVPAKE